MRNWDMASHTLLLFWIIYKSILSLPVLHFEQTGINHLVKKKKKGKVIRGSGLFSYFVWVDGKMTLKNQVKETK